jgi:hypothetical protein
MLIRTLSIALLFVVGCSNAGPSAAISPSPVDAVIVFTPVGDGSAFTAQLNNKTYTLAGAVAVTLDPATYQITGSFHGAGFGVGFQTIGSTGGAQSGSPRSLTGPSPVVAPCGVTYSNSDTPSVDRAFQLQFQVTNDTRAACSGAPP